MAEARLHRADAVLLIAGMIDPRELTELVHACGGYRLTRPAAETTVADVVIAVDEPLRAIRCAGGKTGCMKDGARCLTHDLWEETGRQLRDYLSSVSLADVASGRLRRSAEAAA